MANFRASARAVDMLGRQQIAGIPTAVSEVFKNAYDAYATSVRGDFFPDRRVLLIRDDGVGMTKADFETRWLTVGTESKAPGALLAPMRRPSAVAERRQMGEKGIGRLAMATLGPQLLVITRGRLDDGLASLVVALVQWTLFEVPGLTLDDVSVPIQEVEGLGNFDRSMLSELRSELADTVRRLGDRVPVLYQRRLAAELETLDFDPSKFLSIAGPSLEDASGTAFIVAPVSDDVDAVMEEDGIADPDFPISEFQRFLLGFTNTINPGPDSPDFSTTFYRHETSGPRDIIDPSSYFWESEDFDNTDHTVEGLFDEYGKFSGHLKLYGSAPVEIIEPWTGSRGNKSACGPFSVKFGYVQGKPSESTLPPEIFARMGIRLRGIGGLYIYRDGIRVLPYGNSDNDYLEIEKRRSLNAGRYYFSYRRMFGAIEVDSRRNKELQEKAGREGFRENRAYRDFRSILQGFLIQLATHFFSSTSESSEEWRSERDRLKAQYEMQSNREIQERRARKQFSTDVIDKMNYIESGNLSDDLNGLIRTVSGEIAGESTLTEESITSLESDLERKLSEIRSRLELDRPADLPLSKGEERDWQSYASMTSYAHELIASAASELSAMLGEVRTSYLDQAANKRALSRRIHNLAQVSRDNIKVVHTARQATVEAAERMVEQLLSDASRIVESLESTIDAALLSANDLGLDDEIRIMADIDRVTAIHMSQLENIGEKIRIAMADDVPGALSVGLKEQILDLQEQIDLNLELIQLGQAVQIVSHEFEASIRSVRSGLRALAPWARSTPRLRPIVTDLRAAFAHLDGYLRLFTPLQRRLYREAVLITGDQVASFLDGVFGERLERHGVDLEVHDSFRAWSLTGYPSTFYPVFVNLVDNAIFWVSTMPDGTSRKISLTADGSCAYVSDTGPGVRLRDRGTIFERGFSRRRGGRGLGLSLARDLLLREGWALELMQTPQEGGTVFRISQFGEEEE